MDLATWLIYLKKKKKPMHKCLNTHMSIFYTVYCKNDRETTASTLGTHLERTRGQGWQQCITTLETVLMG